MSQKCIYCSSKNVVKNGTKKRKVRIKNNFLCRSCKRQFVEPDGFERMRHKPEDIVRAVHMHEDGFSLAKTKNHLWQHDGIKVTRWTISQWTSRYSLFLKSNKQGSKTKAQRAPAL